ncbi:hypothetical protein ACFLUY_01215 [Chloroflexota bacterium]
MSNFLFILAIIGVAYGIFVSIMIASFVSKRGIKINYLFFSVLMLKYIHQYKKITTEENGKPGQWFYSFIVSMNLALVLAVVGIILRITVE